MSKTNKKKKKGAASAAPSSPTSISPSSASAPSSASSSTSSSSSVSSTFTTTKSSQFYSLDAILATNAQYNIVIGERSNGKTFAALEYGLRNYIRTGKQMAYVRRWKEDYRGKRGENLFSALADSGKISELTQGTWTQTRYYSGKWHLARFDSDLDKLVYDDEPFCYGFSISDQEHDKSSSFPKITTIIFDEFMTRAYYLQNEFVLFTNVLSTIIRHRADVKIFMLANTVNKYCPYFAEMGLKHVTEMEQGSIDVYTYGSSSLKVAVEYCKPSTKGKESDVYFTFDNPALQMITGGAWEIDMYPHLPRRYTRSQVVFNFYIVFDDQCLDCDVVSLPDCSFIYVHQKTTPIKDETTALIYSDRYSPLPNHIRNLRKPVNRVTKSIAEYFRNDRVYYQDNEVGEIVRNYLIVCSQMK